MALVLSQVGWRVTLLNGGYKTYRDEARSMIDSRPSELTFSLLSGLTGVGKTALLMHLRSQGHQILDLEGLANHRGSALGAAALGPQPSQKLFESRLASALRVLDPARRVWVEAESSRVGEVQVPAALWKAMKAAPRLEVTLPLPARVQRILADYSYWVGNPSELKQALGRFRSKYGQRVDGWYTLIDAGR